MSLRKYLIIMGLGGLICWGAWFLVLFEIDPYNSGFIGILSFYVILYLALLGTLCLIGFFIRLIVDRKTVYFKHIGISLRQSFLFSTLLVISLLLQQHRLFTWWNGVILIAGFSLLEFFFYNREETGRQQ